MSKGLQKIHEQVHRRHHYEWYQALPLLVMLALLIASPISAAKRFQERGLYINSAVAGETTMYRVSFRYMSPDPVGSVDMLFCIDPIPHHPCVTPPGLNVSNAVLSDQDGESGFSILSKSANHIVLTRTPAAITATDPSWYEFDNIVNPTETNRSFSIRLRSHTTTNATGPQVDFGSVMGQITESVNIETQVPPMLIFCAAERVEENCEGTNNNYYADMGELDERSTLAAQSQMAVGTNASSGFVITANGSPLSAGTNVIDSLSDPTESRPGTNQFGINLVANNSPIVGGDPEGAWTNALPTASYSVPNRYKFVSGDAVAESPEVSLMRKFTVSYIINSNPDVRPGVYTTTITYIASGRF
jgi:hypothetical protein